MKEKKVQFNFLYNKNFKEQVFCDKRDDVLRFYSNLVIEIHLTDTVEMVIKGAEKEVESAEQDISRWAKENGIMFAETKNN